MRRLFLAAALALAFHSLLFTVRFEWPEAKLTLPPRPLTLSLTQVPTEPPASRAEAESQPSPDPPPPPSQVTEEKRRPKETRRPEKSRNRFTSSVPLRQEQASAPTHGRGFLPEEIPASETLQEVPSPPQASLGGAGRELPPIPVHEATPLYRQNPVPEYPSIARKRGYQGTVVLEVLVTAEGKVKELALSASSGFSVLDQAALASVNTWLFEPGTRGGEKVDMWVKVPVRFRLE